MKHVFFFLLGLGLIFPFHLSAQSQGVKLGSGSELAQLLTLKNKMTKKNAFGDRYKIQLGSFSSMKSAEEVKEQFEAQFDGFPAELKYESPNYKVWVGNFTTRLSADRVYLKLKEEFKSAFVFKPTS